MNAPILILLCAYPLTATIVQVLVAMHWNRTPLHVHHPWVRVLGVLQSARLIAGAATVAVLAVSRYGEAHPRLTVAAWEGLIADAWVISRQHRVHRAWEAGPLALAFCLMVHSASGLAALCTLREVLCILGLSTLWLIRRDLVLGGPGPKGSAT